MTNRFAQELGNKTKQIIGAMIRNESNWSESLVHHRILFASSNVLMKSVEESAKETLKSYSDKINKTLQSKQYPASSINVKSS